jgi:Family of unknown function (DUF5320)
MPSGDRMGPKGAGPRTGRGAGWCAGFAVPGFANATPGRMMGMGLGYRGGGRGWRNMYYATGLPGWARAGYAPPTPTPEVELSLLKAEAKSLGDQLADINERIKQIEGDQPE